MKEHKPSKVKPNQTSFKEHTKIKSKTNGKEYEIGFGPQPDGKVPANPFASLAQAGYMHAHPEVLGDKLSEWDKASKGKKIPYKVKKKK